jgi:serpin B
MTRLEKPSPAAAAPLRPRRARLRNPWDLARALAGLSPSRAAPAPVCRGIGFAETTGMPCSNPKLSRHGFPLIALAGLAAASGCGDPDGAVTVDEVRSQKVREASPAVAPADRRALADGNAAFALALYRQVEAKNPNLVFSPASISTALAMTFAGARGETETQIAQALRFTLPQARLHPALNEVTAALAARGAGTQGADGKPFRLNIVNTTWAQKGFTMESPFLDVLAQSYGAGVNLLDFILATEASRQTINRWVEQQTEERIKDLIPEGVIDAATRLVLTNAVYFNAAWKTPLDKGTGDGPFYKLGGGTVTVPMMRAELQAPAAELPGLVAVALPYQDERLSMLVVLPDEGKLAEVEGTLAAQGLGPVTSALQKTTVILSMPRFRFETPIDLKDALSALGMPIAFSSSADFTGINADGGLYLQAVLHKAFIAVAEKGTEAAAATAVVVGRTSLPQGLNVFANRPFLFFVRDEPTGAILFMGRVADPSR